MQAMQHGRFVTCIIFGEPFAIEDILGDQFVNGLGAASQCAVDPLMGQQHAALHGEIAA